MADLSTEERCKLAVKLVDQAPPGEVNDVINDIRAIIADDNALMPLILPHLRAYNLSQLTVVEHPASEGVPAHTSLLSEAVIVPGEEEERYVDAVAKRSFVFDHATLAASDFQPYELPEEEETFRAALAKSLGTYAKNHFPSGHCSVSCSQFPLLPPAPPAPAPAPAPATAAPPPPAAEESSAEAAQAADEGEGEAEATGAGVVTDVVPEQVGTGENEPAPTPAVGEAKPEEVTEPGGLEKVDEAVEAEKEEEEKKETGNVKEPGAAPVDIEADEDLKEAEGDAPDDVDEAGAGIEAEPKVEEGVTAVPATEEATGGGGPGAAEAIEAPPAAPQREQQREADPTYTLEVVGNKYNPTNFWTGRWRTRWLVDKAAGTVAGTIMVDVHYYEQGNLATRHTVSFPYPAESGSQSTASQIVTTISKLEAAYQLELNDAYGDLGDKAFRALRRALPVTRQKMDWEKVSGYSLGADLTKARG